MADERPNNIFVITDRQRYDTVHAPGYDDTSRGWNCRLGLFNRQLQA